jgi:hypothetical protein
LRVSDYHAHKLRRFQALSCKGGAHYALLCARVYEKNLKMPKQAAEVVEGLLRLEPEGDATGFALEPLTKIEARRFLAHCYCAIGGLPVKSYEEDDDVLKGLPGSPIEPPWTPVSPGGFSEFAPFLEATVVDIDQDELGTDYLQKACEQLEEAAEESKQLGFDWLHGRIKEDHKVLNPCLVGRVPQVEA